MKADWFLFVAVTTNPGEERFFTRGQQLLEVAFAVLRRATSSTWRVSEHAAVRGHSVDAKKKALRDAAEQVRESHPGLYAKLCAPGPSVSQIQQDILRRCGVGSGICVVDARARGCPVRRFLPQLFKHFDGALDIAVLRRYRGLPPLDYGAAFRAQPRVEALVSAFCEMEGLEVFTPSRKSVFALARAARAASGESWREAVE